MRNRILPFGLVPALLGSVLMFALTGCGGIPPTPANTTSQATEAKPATAPIQAAPATTTNQLDSVKACTKSCFAGGSLQPCKLVNNVAMYPCPNPTNLCSGGCN